ncbi:MAG: amidohydrolase family protein, partial [Phycisphaerales bacterium]
MRATLRAASLFASALFAAVSLGLAAQPPGPLQPPPNSPRRADPTHHALVGATVHVSPTVTIQNATVVLRDGRIESVGGADVPPPAGARAWDSSGLHVYAGFIDPYVEVEALKPDLEAKGAHWNTRVTPQRDALDGKGLTEDAAKSLRSLGFVAAAISPRGGVFRGSSAVVSLARPDADISQTRPPVFAERVYQSVAFETDGGEGGPERWQGYPGSLMGAIALVRQTLIDADWEEARREGTGAERAAGDATALAPLFRGPKVDGRPGTGPMLLMNTDDELDVARVQAVAREFSRPFMVLGSGNEYQRLGMVVEAGVPILLPVNFPRKPKVDTIGDAEGVSLRELMAFEQAPTNPRRLVAAGATVALTTAKLRDKGQFRENVRQAIRHGLSEGDALAMLTTTPAQLLGMQSRFGTIESGKSAGLIVSDGPIFARKTKIRDIWVDGRRHEINPAPHGVEGVFDVTLTPPPAMPGRLSWEIEKDSTIVLRKVEDQPAAALPDAGPKDPDPKPEAGEAAPDAAAKADALEPQGDAKPAAKDGPATKPSKPKPIEARAKGVMIANGRVSFTFEHEPFGQPGVFTIAGLVNERGRTISGVGTRADGARFSFEAVRREPVPSFTGSWRVRTVRGAVAAAADEWTLSIDKENAVSLRGKEKPSKGTAVEVKESVLTFTLEQGLFGGGAPAKVRLTLAGMSIDGLATDADGKETPFTLGRREDDEDETPPGVPEELPGLPFGPYAMSAYPEQENVIITGATVWTSGDAGNIQDGVVVIEKGTISFAGSAADFVKLGRALEGYRNIDARGKHVTPGLIDCHSHTGISRGVNEGGQAVTAEVRIADVTDPDAISWYRQLAGGITTVNNLHGSANAIGGQNQVNKNRWGTARPNDLHFEGAIPGIKFALGENPKGSNGQGSWRYPQTRMGVEALIRDRFTAAREYGLARRDAEQQARAITLSRIAPEEQARRLAELAPPRRDLELEALFEIIEGKRLVHCHSYRQDEILMLARIAQEFGFKIGTYQHILEGYKVAEVVRDYSGGGSCFSDWWAYKVEVQDAIPQGGPIMHEQGAVVSFNSDSDEMARRMNVEAAKAVKYSDGSISPAEALKFVTLNPARQLRVEGRVGSLEAGKDADVVIWSG